MYEISKELWTKCNICNKTLKDIKIEFGGKNCYFSDAFKDHLKKYHSLSLEEYFENIIKLNRPICKCNICNNKVSATIKGAKIYWRDYVCGRYEGTLKWSEQAKETRKGSGNPMFQGTPWNKGLGIEDPRIEKIAANFRGKKLSIEHIEKLKKAAFGRESPMKGKHHSKETCEKLRQNTLKMIKNGVFNQIKSKCHIKMSLILDELNIEYEEEKLNGHFSFDFYLPDSNIYIEVDGDYFHSNPKFYPNGPKSKTQKINYARDCSKNKYCKINNIKLYRFWEDIIINNPELIKEQLICILKK